MPDLLPFVVSGLGVGAVYALSGVGLVVLYRSSGVLNFAFGALGAVAAHVAWSMLNHEVPQALAWLGAIGTAMALSLAYGRWLAPRHAQRAPTIRRIRTQRIALVRLGSRGAAIDRTDRAGTRWYVLDEHGARLVDWRAGIAAQRPPQAARAAPRPRP